MDEPNSGDIDNFRSTPAAEALRVEIALRQLVRLMARTAVAEAMAEASPECLDAGPDR
jgi:hypothetical protein